MPGRDDDEHVGYPTGRFFRRRNGDADDLMRASDETPIDLAAVQADDALLNTLGHPDAARYGADADLARVLVAWRREVDTEAISQLVDTDTAVAMIGTARRPASRRHRALGPIAVAAAALVVAFSGVGLVAKSAQPGDQLFVLTKFLYADYARSVEAADKVETELVEAQTAIIEGKKAEARESLAIAREQLTVINDEQGHARLATEHRNLEEMLDGTSSPADPDLTTEPAPQTSSSNVTVQPVPPPESTITTKPAESSSGRPPPPTGLSTPPSPPGGRESPQPQTSGATPGSAVPLAGEASSPPATSPSR